MLAGVLMTGIQIARNGMVSTRNPFIYYPHSLKLGLMISLLSFFCFLPNFLTYINPDSITLELLSFCLTDCLWALYSFSIPLMLDKQLGLGAALKTSRKMALRGGFKTPVLFVFLHIICLIGMLPLGIGLIWCGPFALICYGILYRDLSAHDTTNLEAATIAQDVILTSQKGISEEGHEAFYKTMDLI
jgi:hypothetical protein